MWVKHISIFLFLYTNSVFSSHPIFDHALTNLSDYKFFELPIKNQIPNKNIIPYTIASPLFSDYAEKLRFIWVPENSKISYDGDNNFIYPENTFL